MRLLDAVRLAFQTLRVQKLKSFFTLAGVTIGVMFLIAVVSIVEGMGSYMENDFVAKLIGINTPPGAIIAALAMSALTGMVFGLWPAMKASRLDPVDALRFE